MRFLVSPTRKMRFSVTSPTQNALFRYVEVASPAQNALFRYVAAREAWDTTPRQPAGHYGKWPNWADVLAQPPARLAGGCAGDPQASAWGPASRKSAVWAEGLAESAPRARPGHHQAASCGLRGCRELSITSLAPRPRGPCPASSGRWALTPGSPPPRPLSRELRAMGVDTRFPALSAPPRPRPLAPPPPPLQHRSPRPRARMW